MSDVNQKQQFTSPTPKYTQELLRGKLHCPHCGQRIHVRTTLT